MVCLPQKKVHKPGVRVDLHGHKHREASKTGPWHSQYKQAGDKSVKGLTCDAFVVSVTTF